MIAKDCVEGTLKKKSPALQSLPLIPHTHFGSEDAFIRCFYPMTCVI